MRATRCVSAAALVFLSFFTTASAVTLNPRGIGQALVYPYYTVNAGQDTLVSIVNSGDTGKAVEVRYREGYNARVVLQFVVFLSPHDVWTASLSSIADDDGAPTSGRASCHDTERRRSDPVSILQSLTTVAQQVIDSIGYAGLSLVMLVENVVLGVAGGVFGVLLAYWGLSWIVTHGPAEMPRVSESRIDGGAVRGRLGKEVGQSSAQLLHPVDMRFGTRPDHADSRRDASEALARPFRLLSRAHGCATDDRAMWVRPVV